MDINSLNGRITPEDTFVILNAANNKKCKFCNKKKSSEQLYGMLYQLNDIIAHHYCTLLSSQFSDNEENPGIWRLLEYHIKKEIHRGSTITCCYCNKKGATISCRHPRCKKEFHLPCGMQHNSMHQFFGEFKSFCELHRLDQVFDTKNLASIQCVICLQPISHANIRITSLKAPCCNDTWFHRHCIQDVALNSGYCFRCPICNNNDEFEKTMLTYGIYIPPRQPTWEFDTDAFIDLIEEFTCDAENCLCPEQNGRNFDQVDGPWRSIVCNSCGSNETHARCSGIGNEDNLWNCKICISVIGGPKEPKRKQ